MDVLSLTAQPVVVLNCRNCLGESIIWDDRAGLLRWVNIHDREVWSWDPMGSSSPEVLSLSDRIGAIGLSKNGGLIAAFAKSFAVLDGQETQTLADVDLDLPTVRLNDGRVDPAGRFVCGGMDESSPQRGVAALYSLGKARRVKKLLSGISCTNSLCWSVDGGTLYFTDMPTRRIDAFDYDVRSGEISNRRVFASLNSNPGLADGSIVDAEGCLWNAQWRGSKLVRYRPDGTVEREVSLPVSNPTCMTFGGPNLDILFVTTAWFTLNDEELRAEPLAGNIFAFRPGVRGQKEYRYEA